MSDRSKLTYMVHVSDHSSEQCKFINNFGTGYNIISHFKEGGHGPTNDIKYKKKKKVNNMLKNTVDGVIQENEKKIQVQNFNIKSMRKLIVTLMKNIYDINGLSLDYTHKD